MKASTQIGLTSLVTFLVTLNFSISASAQNSAELSCRNRAKEIAAETYKGCMTDVRQTQLEQIRKDYKEKLSDLKSHYDKELKKLSSGKQLNTGSSSPASSPSSDDNNIRITTSTETKRGTRTGARASGARSLPAKKAPVKTEVIDLSSPAGTGNELDSTELSKSENRLKIEQDEANSVEIVELPTQE